MGEMASSVAHELNQPLAAITNYCNGMVSRVRADQMRAGRSDRGAEKTARQAQRAGQIIHRIRAFVKRSEPQRQPARRRSSRTRSAGRHRAAPRNVAIRPTSRSACRRCRSTRSRSNRW